MERTIIGTVYLDMFQNFLIPQFDQDYREGNMLWHDSDPCHFDREVHWYFYSHFPNWWAGQVDPISWPPRSPDFNSISHFLLASVKDNVCFLLLLASVENCGQELEVQLQKLHQATHHSQKEILSCYIC